MGNLKWARWLEGIRSAAVSSQVVGTLRVRGAVAGGKSGLGSTSLRRQNTWGWMFGCSWGTIKLSCVFSSPSHTWRPPFPVTRTSQGKIPPSTPRLFCYETPPGPFASTLVPANPQLFPGKDATNYMTEHVVVMGKKCYSWQSFPSPHFLFFFFLKLNCSVSGFESQYFSKQKALSLEKIQFIPLKFFAITSA